MGGGGGRYRDFILTRRYIACDKFKQEIHGLVNVVFLKLKFLLVEFISFEIS